MDAEKSANKSIVLNSMLLRAWRERWTDSQWGINMKTVIPKGVSGDVYNLADCILQQAVVGADANKLVLSYLRHSLCSRQVSHAAVLKRISKYDGFDRSYCLIALLDFLESVINGVICRSKTEEAALPNAMLSLVYWLSQIFASILEEPFINEMINSQQLKNLNLLIKLLEKIVNNSFLMGIIYVGKQEDQDLLKKLQKKYVDVKNILTHTKFHSLAQAKTFEELLKHVAAPNKSVSITILDKNIPNIEVEPITYCLQPMITVEVLLNPNCSTQTYVSKMLMIQKLKHYSASRLYYELIRSVLASLYNVSGISGTNRESMWCAFTFIKVPYILQQLKSIFPTASETLDYSPDVVAALEMLIDDPILDYLDTKCACNTIEYLLTELVVHHLITEQHVHQFSSRRDSMMIALSGIELNNQQPSIIKLLKRAEPPLTGILKALDGDYNKMQEPLLLMLCQVLSGSGNSLELILSVATVEGKLKTFVSRLIRCNESSKPIVGELEKAAMNRSALFDVSFLMLTFIVQTYGSDVVLDQNGDSFFEKWVRDCMLDKNKNKSPMQMVHQCDQNKVDEILTSISSTDSNQMSLSSLKSQDICMNIPAVIYHLLVAWENETISATEVKTHLDNIKSRQCSFSVCAASWLCSYMHIVRDDELLKPMNMVKQFLTIVTPEEINQQDNFKERLGLAIQIIRKMQNDIHQNQKSRSFTQNIVSQQPLEEQFHEVWKTISDRGWLPVESTQLLDSLLHTCGPFWLVSKMVNEILHCKFAKDMNKIMDIVFAIMHLNIESCTVALLQDLLPMLLINRTQKFELIEPQLSVLARLCVYCIASALEHDTRIIAKRRLHNISDPSDTSGRSAKMRKLDYPSGVFASVGVNNQAQDESTTYPIREPLLSCFQNLFNIFAQITITDELTPKLYFVQKFLTFLQECGSNRIVSVFSLMPSGLIPNLLKVMNTNDFSYDFILKMYDLNLETGRQRAVTNLTLLRSIQMQKPTSI